MLCIDSFLNAHFCGKTVKSGDIAYNAEQVCTIIDAAIKEKWIILGGDMYFENGECAYANWYYQPNPTLPLMDNVMASVAKCTEFISKSSERSRNNLFVLVISDSYVSGM